MSETWKQWEGRVVDGRFTLGKYLGGSDHSAVYETEVATPRPRRAAIKLVAESTQEDAQLHRWEIAAGLSHPNLLTIHGSGTCRVDEQEMLYAVMEFAEEDLSQILPQRPLTAEEARGMLAPILEGLAFLHSQNIALARLKPSNVMAIGDQIKLACDAICPEGAAPIQLGTKSLYDAPEANGETATPAGDLWSLGVTLTEALTQHHPSWRESASGDLSLAEDLPQPFQTIVSHLLERDPAKRWTVDDVKIELDPVLKAQRAEQVKTAARAKAVPKPAAIAPVAAAAQASREDVRPSPRAVAQNSREERTGRRLSPLWFLIPGLAFGAALIAWVAITRSTPTPANTPATLAAADKTERPTAKTVEKAPAPREDRAARTSAQKGERKSKPAETPAPTPAKLSEDVKPKLETTGNAKGQVLGQVLPEISEKARGTIRGTVRVSVRAHVEPSGRVSTADLESPSSSQYFADQALKAVKRWEFISPEAGGRSVPSEWVVRFEFTSSATRAYPRQVTP